MSLIQADTDMSSSPPELKAEGIKTSGQISMTVKTAAIDCRKNWVVWTMSSQRSLSLSYYRCSAPLRHIRRGPEKFGDWKYCFEWMHGRCNSG